MRLADSQSKEAYQIVDKRFADFRRLGAAGLAKCRWHTVAPKPGAARAKLRVRRFAIFSPHMCSAHLGQVIAGHF